MLRYVVVAGVLFLGALVFLFSRSYSESKVFADMQRCFSAEDSYKCLRADVDTLLKHEKASVLMEHVSTSFLPGLCHIIGHVVGQEIYAESTSMDSALLECSQACSSACTHGVVGAALRAIPGIGATPEEVAHPNLDLLRSEGPKFCIGRDECHAIGHVLFQLFDDLPKSLSWCDDIATKEPWMCYRGVFMENNMTITADNGGSEAEKFREPDNLLSPCDTTAPKYRRACYHFLSINQETTLGEQGSIDSRAKQDQRKDACETLPAGRDRDSCIEGYGYSFPIFADLPKEEVRDRCTDLGQESERAACLFGYAHSLADFTRVSDAYAVCAAVSEATSKRACYEALFDALQVRKIDDVAHACDAVADTACAPILATFIAHPRALVFAQDDSDLHR